MSWLQKHLDTFVKPIIGDTNLSIDPQFFTPEEKTVIKNLWRSMKRHANGKVIILPGRDVFIFEILAQRENYPTEFYPNCSRNTVSLFKGIISPSKALLDTGFLGSIPAKLNVLDFKLVSFAIRGSNVQIFPHLSFSRSLALKIESTPKYWGASRLVNNKICQDISPFEEFARAAALTREIYTDSSPSFVNKHKPIGEIYYATKKTNFGFFGQ